MIRVGILFGGPSREREISFAGGRTVYDNLNKSLFEAVPIFIDSHKNFILLDWEYVYKGTIRDFYPPVEFHPPTDHNFQVYIDSLPNASKEIPSSVGKVLSPEMFKDYFDVAFLALHGQFGEDGVIQSLLENVLMPYTGSGIMASAMGMDKSIQKHLMGMAGFDVPEMLVINKKDWKRETAAEFYARAKEEIGFPLVIRPANQGSSIGVSILMQDNGEGAFAQKISDAFFQQHIEASSWNSLTAEERIKEIQEITDLRSGIGFPMDINGQTIYHPNELLTELDTICLEGKDVFIEGHFTESKVVIEGFIKGREFSCIVMRKDNGEVIALPPTEIAKQTELYDYKSKYLPGLSRKITPIDLEDNKLIRILEECKKLYSFLNFQVYARIDGFYGDDDKIYLNDPNTTSGMLPSSFFFHQAAEIGLNPSQFLTLIIRNSLNERMMSETTKGVSEQLLVRLDDMLANAKNTKTAKKNVGVIFGGYSFERHISVESGRNIYEKLASSAKYNPIPIFLLGDEQGYELYEIPIPLLLKDNADDIRDKILNYKVHPVVEEIRKNNIDITSKYSNTEAVKAPIKLDFGALAQKVDLVFIALHGRPGEDGNIQEKLKAAGIPYNGSDYESSHVTIDKFRTLQTLKEHGFTTADQLLLNKSNTNEVAEKFKNTFEFPFILKPVDDGCSSAVKMIKTEEELSAYLDGIFRDEESLDKNIRGVLDLADNEEFPRKSKILGESLITSEKANHFLEVTGGLLTHMDEEGNIRYEMFEPSEALSSGEILSLEEKFLAGEGQNITPARFAKNKIDYEEISKQVKGDLERAARILKVKGYARIDAFVRIYDNNKAETIIIEVNSLPGMTPATCIFHQCALNGYKPYEFIDKILEFAGNQCQEKEV
jgi:D-alanine-D-alanine ligase